MFQGAFLKSFAQVVCTTLVVGLVGFVVWKLPTALNEIKHTNLSQTVAAQVSDHTLPLAKKTSFGQPNVQKAFNQLPLRFEKNLGQFEESIDYAVKNGAMALGISATSANLQLSSVSKDTGEAITANLQLEFVGALESRKIVGDTLLAGHSNYFRGSDPRAWQTNVPAFERVEIEQIYAGIDLVYHGDNQALEYDFRLAPGANPNQIALRFNGIEAVKITADGELALETPAGTILQRRPFAYQQVAGKQLPVEADYLLADNGDIHFLLAAYDTSRQLIIDPVLVYSTYFGSTGNDRVSDMVVNQNDRLIVVGSSDTLDFPAATDAALIGHSGETDLYVVGLSPAGDTVEFLTFIGPVGDASNTYPLNPRPTIELCSDGSFAITATTDSSDYPTVSPIQPSLAGSDDTVIAILNAAGDQLQYSSYLGGSARDNPTGITCHPSGAVTVVGTTYSSDFPVVNAYQQSDAGNSGFITQLAPDHQSYSFSTYLGQAQYGGGSLRAIDSDDFGNSYVVGALGAGHTFNVDGLDITTAGGRDGVILKFAADGSLVMPAFIGGSSYDVLTSITVSGDNAHLHVVGDIYSSDYNALDLPIPLTNQTGSGQLLATLNTETLQVEHSAFLDFDRGTRSLLELPDGGIAVVGATYFSDLPLVNEIQAPPDGTDSGALYIKSAPIVIALDANYQNVTFSSYLGSSDYHIPSGGAIDSNGDIYLGGQVYPNYQDLPLVNAIQSLPAGGNSEGYLIKIDLEINLPPTITSTPATSVDIGVEYSYDVDAADPNGDSLVYRLISAPSGMVIDEFTGVIGWMPDSAGDYPVEIEVDDSQGGLDSQDWTITVIQPSLAPVITSAPIATGTFGVPYSYDVNASDADGDTLTYSLITSPLGMTIDSFSGLVTWTPDIGGDTTVVVQVSDGNGGTASQTYVLNIAIPNQTPIITSTAIISGQVDADYNYLITATDADGDPLNFSLTNAPLGMIINSASGEIIWLPRDSGSFDVLVTVDDGRGGVATQQYTLVIAFGPGDFPPVLTPIGDQIAPLGSTLSVQLSATDNEPLTFIAEPMPLPAGMQLDTASGLFTFAPLVAGTHSITFIASDGRFEDAETITITVPPPPGITSLRGQILTTNGAPLANVRLEVEGVETLTDVNGNYQLDNLPTAGDVRLLVDGSTVSAALGVFATVPEIIHLIEGADNLLDPPIILLPLDVGSADPVTPSTTSIITSSQYLEEEGGLSDPVTLTIPPGAAINDATGLPFEGDIHISRIEDPTQGPRPLPAGLGLSVYIAIQPFGVTYPTPVPISFPNLEGFPPDSRLDFFALDHETGLMEKIGEGLVSADGKTVDSIGGIVKSNSWHGIVPQAPQAAPETPQDQSEPNDDGSDDPKKDPDCCPGDNCDQGGCTIDKQTGNLSEDHSLPGYVSLQTQRTVRLEYNSNNANIQPIIPMISGFGNQAPPPTTMSMRISVGGVIFGEEKFSQVRVEQSPVINQFKTTRPAIQFDGNSLITGLHDYAITVECQFPVSFRSDTVPGELIINNQHDSAFGAGWTLAGLQQVHEQSNAKVLLTTGTATSLVYTPINATDFSSAPGDFTTLTRLADGRLMRRMRSGVEYIFDSAGRQEQETDRNGNITTYQYDTNGRLERIVDPVGKEFVFSYFAGRIDSITDPLNRVTSFEHDAEGNLTRIIEPNGDDREFEYQQNNHLMIAQLDQRDNRKEYSFDFAGRIKEVTLPDSSTLQFNISDVQGLLDPETYAATREEPAPAPLLEEEVNNTFTDQNSNLSEILSDTRNQPLEYLDAVGRVTSQVRDADSNPTQTTRPNGSQVNRSFDTDGKLLSRTEQFNGAVTQYSYDPFALVTSVTNPNNHTTTITRDSLGNATQIINHLGHTTTLAYDSRGLVTQIDDPNGLVSTLSYNLAGLVETLTQTPPVGSPGNVRVSQYSYDSVGQTTQVITPDGIVLEMVYDTKGRLESVTDNLNQSIVYGYDQYDNLIQTDTFNSDSNLALTVARAFDNRNRLTHIAAPHLVGESVSQRTLDNNSNLTGLTDPNLATSSNVYDAEDRLIENTHRLNGITRYTYDTLNRITEVIAPNGVTTHYGYDLLGRRTSEQSPDRGTLTYGYDLANNLTTITDGRGITATLTYDELERVITKTYPNSIPGKIENVTYSYDTCAFGLGYLCTVTDESGSYDYEYDGFGNLTQIIKTELAVAYTTEYQYDDGDNISQMTLPSGRVIDYQRDGIRRISAIDTSLNGTPQNIVSAIQYRGDSQMTQCTFGNGLIDDRTYDLQGRLTGQTLQTDTSFILDQRNYGHDANSNILSILTDFEDNAYQYDALDRIIDDSIDSDTPIQFQYDLNDNRLNKDRADQSAAQRYTYEPGSNQIAQLEVFQSGATPLDPLPNRDLVYSDTGRLFQLLEDGLLKAEYIYNDQGQRTRKTLYQPDGITVDSITIFHYDQMGYLVTETTETGALLKDYIWQEGMHPIAQIDNQGTETITYLHTDHLMTARLATDDLQTITWRWEGEAFGNTPAQELAGTQINLRFPGQYFDQESNLHYNWNRYYDPGTGRYITSDPIGLQGGINTFGYVDQNPLLYIDPTGEIIPQALLIIGTGALVAKFVIDAGERAEAQAEENDRFNEGAHDPNSDFNYDEYQKNRFKRLEDTTGDAIRLYEKMLKKAVKTPKGGKNIKQLFGNESEGDKCQKLDG